MPRFSRFADEAFPDNAGFRQLVGFLFEDIVEFHRKVYAWITKPGMSIALHSTEHVLIKYWSSVANLLLVAMGPLQPPVQ